MRFDTTNLKGNLKLRLLLGASVLLFLFKILVYNSSSILAVVFNEIFTLAAAAAMIIYFLDSVHSKRISPLALVMNVGILNAVIFLLFTFSDSILSGILNTAGGVLKNEGLLTQIVSLIYGFIILISVSIIFLVFRELYFLKQRKDVSVYYNTMVVFFVLASLSAFLKNFNGLDYIKDTFFIISILLVIFNSIKISWIAFIVKKEKVSLLVLSVVIAVLFAVNLVNMSRAQIHSQLIDQFSPALTAFLKIIMTYGLIYFSILFFTTLFHIPTAEAFDRKAQEVSFLKYFSSLITESTDFKELSEAVTDIAVKVSNSHSAWIAWKEEGEFKPIANRNIGYYDSTEITKFVTEHILKKGKEDYFSFNINKHKNKPSLSEQFFGIAGAPIKTRNEISGYLITATKTEYVYDDEDKDTINTFSDYASVAFDNSRLLEESIEKERMEKELDVAREIQRKILPSANPAMEKLNISSVFIPAFEVGGDYYDFFEISDDKLGFVIADVSGKGISAAFIMAEIKGIFESLAKTISNPKDILIKANDILQRTLDRKNFVSAAYGVIDFNEEMLSVARAGHCPIMLVRENSVENIRPSGIGLGLNFTSHFAETLEEFKIDLKENDLVVLYTDGITEAKNLMMEDFGSRKFEKILLENCDKDVEDISRTVISEVTQFSQNNSQHDDITLVILKWKQKFIKHGVEEWQNLAPQLKK